MDELSPEDEKHFEDEIRDIIRESVHWDKIEELLDESKPNADREELRRRYGKTSTTQDDN